MVAVNSISCTNFGKGLFDCELPKKAGKYVPQGAVDSFEPSNKSEKIKVSTPRAIFGYLTQEQIDEINRTRKLPKNVKISRTKDGSFYMRPNWFNISRGTHKIPEGFELRRNLAGFTEVVPIGEEGLTLRKAV